MTKTLKHAVAVCAIIMVVAPAFLFAVEAGAQPNLGIDYATNLGLTSAANTDPRDAAVDVVRYLMTFLAIIAVIVILIGGFRWMTASGNEDRVASAKKTIIAGAIGLIIILAAYAIVTFVITTTTNLLN